VVLNKSNVIGIFCDISKAFNSVNQSTLMTKHIYYGTDSNDSK